MKCNRLEVLENVEKRIKEAEEHNARYPYWKKRYPMREVCDELSIFDWWPDELSLSRLKEMKAFLILAGKYGYDGYVCFKVGATGCANGMWAHRKESTDGYSPDGECLYRSFTPDYIAYDAQLADGSWVSDRLKTHNITLKMLKQELAKE